MGIQVVSKILLLQKSHNNHTLLYILVYKCYVNKEIYK